MTTLWLTASGCRAQRARRLGARSLVDWTGGEDAAGDGARLFAHLRYIGEGAHVPQIGGAAVEDVGETRGGGGLWWVILPRPICGVRQRELRRGP